eukprot:364849-Chlamydomonas_euryale.AAC.9
MQRYSKRSRRRVHPIVRGGQRARRAATAAPRWPCQRRRRWYARCDRRRVRGRTPAAASRGKRAWYPTPRSAMRAVRELWRVAALLCRVGRCAGRVGRCAGRRRICGGG